MNDYRPPDSTAQEQRISEMLRAHLDESVENYDAATLSRLNQARQHALDALPTTRHRQWFWPGLGLAAAMALVLMLSVQRQSLTTSPDAVGDSLVGTQLSVDEIALLASDDDLEMFQDLEFYAWLEQQPDWDGSSS